MTINWANEEEFWQVAARSTPLRFRVFGWSLTVEQIDAQVGQFSEWTVLKETLNVGDLIWPIEFNHNSLAYRKGFVIIRDGKPLGGIITLVS